MVTDNSGFKNIYLIVKTNTVNQQLHTAVGMPSGGYILHSFKMSSRTVRACVLMML
eukprot:SAG31_NODE_2361_length_5869_cov_3.154246_1_plen_56_part_00